MTRRPLAALFASMLTLPAMAQDTGAVAAGIDAMYPKLEAIYKDLHAHPELAFQEVRTAGKLAAELRAIGFQVTEQVGKTGIVAIYRNGPGPTVLVRTEMDGLPMEEKSGVAYASKAHAQLDGKDTMVAHSCGHDVHMTAWLATARTLVALKSQWRGTLMFVGQPAEEIVAGAKAMIADGLFTRFGKPDYAFALHSWPLAYGTIGYNSGPVSSNSDAIEITFKGHGGHGSAPDKAVDPVMIAARFVVDVQTVVSREKDPKEFGVVTIGAINGGSVGNIIPDSVKVRGTIRSYTPPVRAKLLAGVRRTAFAAAAMADAPAPDVELIPGGAAIINDDKLVTRTEGVLKQAFGNDKVSRMPAMTASEDFSQFADAGIPAMFFFTGVYAPEAVAEADKPGGKPIAFNHSPYYAPVPEPSIKTAARAMTLAVMNVMQPAK
ncbi:peptidase M20 [Duganella sp. Leaf126]|uniref:amidohydrolase n=1 Tax=Duganella sp. Leaf126 TaxID=1736266 RepID=UPI0006FBA5A3|nr:amidohydrolase [Duganella sp. Leaf126]KQQ47609.1 peptidase M20 [Duganella sp. Leaf126]